MSNGAAEEATVSTRIGLRIRELREKHSLSMRALAERTGVSQPFLSQIERGVSSPSMATIYRLAEALGVTPGDLLPAPASGSAVVVRADEGRLMPVADRSDSAVGRALLFADDSALQMIEYRIRPGEYLSEWFDIRHETGLYVVSGTVDVEIDGGSTHRLGAGDFVALSPGLRERWTLVGEEPAHLVLAVAMERR